ncbi:MAG TPA: glycosyltransferase family 2 protein [Methylomirabilota bacterium]|nr:glycosyltransferase family 2 protein [Methylomirabilota bacterium]
MKKLVSYIFPIHNESGNIELLHDVVSKVIASKSGDYEFELIFINDGSQDDSLAKLTGLQESDDRVVLINFARNFGHQLAVTAGLDHASGDAVIIMDSDMQDPPSVSLELLAKWEKGADVVYAQRRSRKDTVFKRLTASLFYKGLEKVADVKIPRNTGDFRLLDRKVVDALNTFREHDRFLRGLVSYIGFTQTAVQFDRDERHAGETSYPLSKMFKFAADGILGFSTLPLKLISRIGYIFSLLSFLGIAYALAIKIFDPERVVAGWTFTVIAILLVGGVQLVVLGVLGSYIGRIYTEVQNRPLYIIESITPRKRK